MKHTPVINDSATFSSAKTMENRSPRKYSGKSSIAGTSPKTDRTDIRSPIAYAGGHDAIPLLDLQDASSILDQIDRLGRSEIFGAAHQTPNRENTFALLAS